MTTTIPAHLSHLPTWHGLPVPYINCWGDEVDDHQWTMGYDPNVGQQAWFTGPARGGGAFLAKQCLQRQREIAVHGLCQVCRREITKDRWLMVWAENATTLVEHGDRATIMCEEPWLCTRCVPVVLNICPGIKKRDRTVGLRVVRVHHHRLLVSNGWHDSFGPEILAAMWVKIVPLDYELFTLEQALEVTAQ